MDQTTGISTGPEPTATLSTFRHDERVQGVTFGQNLIVVRETNAVLHAGAIFELKFTF